MKPPTIGIIDLGRARFKMSLWDNGELLWATSIEVGQAITRHDEQLVTTAISSAASELRTEGANRIIFCSGSFLRTEQGWREKVRSVVWQLADDAFLLTPDDEGRMLFLSASADGNDTVLDIGGGSVQLVWRLGSEIVTRSWQLGTYSLETDYALVLGNSPWSQYLVALNGMKQMLLADCLPLTNHILAGSNVMKNAFEAIAQHVPVADVGAWTSGELLIASEYCSSLTPNDFPTVYPDIPTFMFGADKALLVAHAFSDLLSATVEGTNASISHGLALQYSALAHLPDSGLERL